MSGICGILRLDGGPVAPAQLRKMGARLERRAPEGFGVWIGPGVPEDGGDGELFGIAPPQAVREDLFRDRTALRLAGRFRDTLLDGTGGQSRGSVEIWWLQVRARDSVGEGIALGRSLLLTPSPAEWGPEPGGSSFGWALRPLRRIRRLVSRS